VAAGDGGDAPEIQHPYLGHELLLCLLPFARMIAPRFRQFEEGAANTEWIEDHAETLDEFW
jgi:hypothetical protein